jgi:hypothetical protein
MSQRLVAHARLSTHKFPTIAEELKSLIYNFPPTFSQYRLYYDLQVSSGSDARADATDACACTGGVQPGSAARAASAGWLSPARLSVPCLFSVSCLVQFTY